MRDIIRVIRTFNTLNGRFEDVVVSEDVYLAYMRPLWRVAKQQQRAKRCPLGNGKRCHGDCNSCKLIPGQSFSMDVIKEEGVPKSELRKGHYEPHTNEDLAELVYHNDLISNLLAIIDTLEGAEKVLAEDFLDGIAEAVTAKKLGCCQKTVSNNRKKLFAKLYNLLTK